MGNIVKDFEMSKKKKKTTKKADVLSSIIFLVICDIYSLWAILQLF